MTLAQRATARLDEIESDAPLEERKADARRRNDRWRHRANVGMRVFLNSAIGVTRDISASGVYFWISGTYAVGQTIRFSIELKRARGSMMRKCKGKIVRVEPQDHRRVGLAVRITESTMVPFKS